MPHRGPARIAAHPIRAAIIAALTAAAAVAATRSLSPALGESDGVVVEGVSVFDDRIPAVANLAPHLRRALRRAARDAAREGIEVLVNSGWRSPAYQEQLVRDAVAKHGSQKKAARWVASPDSSSPVFGEAVDIGPSRAAAWLSRRGAAYGLCRIYRNESWHYEFRPEAVASGCPSMYADASRDSRVRQ
jgi:D-alanyl-D-alanine carboxypeptidase